MNFTDALFILLLFALTIFCAAMRNYPRVREWSIIAFSILFIASWGMLSLALFLAVSALNYAAVAGMTKANQRLSAFILICAIGCDIAILAVFKYASFIGTNVKSLTGLIIPTFTLGIPLAISFYTFHIISYLVDVHRGRIHRASPRQYFFYLSFFPHVIAGPIVRAWQLVPQIGRKPSLSQTFPMGIHYFVVGAFLKAVVADNIGNVIDPIWQDQTGFILSAADRWLTAFLYYCQIYSDFAGYSLMALGIAKCLGYRLPANFRCPMQAASLQEFWRRWHITLSYWLRDYLYFSLGGSRAGAARTTANILITMLLGGLWHGAGWNFVIWGAMHGIGLVGERALGLQRTRAFSGHWIGWWLVTQIWVTMAWAFFRAPDLPHASTFVAGMMRVNSLSELSIHSSIGTGSIFAVPVILHQLSPLWIGRLRGRSLGAALGVSTGAILILDLIVFSPARVFIYFKF